MRVGALHCRVEGRDEAPPMVLINSLGCDLHMWDAQAEAFRARFRLIRYDPRGHGRSEAPPGPYTIDQLGGDVVGLLDALDLERVHVCGLSLGGMVALWVAARHPHRLERAVFASTAGRIGTPELWEARAEAVRSGGMSSVRDVFVERYFSESFRRDHPETVRRMVDALNVMSAEGYAASCLALRDADLRPLIPTIRAPSLIVAGRRDVATPMAEAEWLHSRIEGSGLEVLDAAHMCNVEQPERFTEAATRFLTGARPVRHPEDRSRRRRTR